MACTGEWIDEPGALKAAHFVQQCSECLLPLIFLQNTPDIYAHTEAHFASMPFTTPGGGGAASSTGSNAGLSASAVSAGSKEWYENRALDHALALKGHAKLTSVVATARVPKITVVIGNSFPPLSYALVFLFIFFTGSLFQGSILKIFFREATFVQISNIMLVPRTFQ